MQRQLKFAVYPHRIIVFDASRMENGDYMEVGRICPDRSLQLRTDLDQPLTDLELETITEYAMKQDPFVSTAQPELKFFFAPRTTEIVH